MPAADPEGTEPDSVAAHRGWTTMHNTLGPRFAGDLIVGAPAGRTGTESQTFRFASVGAYDCDGPVGLYTCSCCCEFLLLLSGPVTLVETEPVFTASLAGSIRLPTRIFGPSSVWDGNTGLAKNPFLVFSNWLVFIAWPRVSVGAFCFAVSMVKEKHESKASSQIVVSESDSESESTPGVSSCGLTSAAQLLPKVNAWPSSVSVEKVGLLLSNWLLFIAWPGASADVVFSAVALVKGPHGSEMLRHLPSKASRPKLTSQS
mmetsp:Transcript_124210/g.397559  ORF Transcript_124210/g.397559 Transcript_124210/m.397559 type:complete len:260 (+) Transcript_124210:1406-2185(+)